MIFRIIISYYYPLNMQYINDFNDKEDEIYEIIQKYI